MNSALNTKYSVLCSCNWQTWALTISALPTTDKNFPALRECSLTRVSTSRRLRLWSSLEERRTSAAGGARHDRTQHATECRLGRRLLDCLREHFGLLYELLRVLGRWHLQMHTLRLRAPWLTTHTMRCSMSKEKRLLGRQFWTCCQLWIEPSCPSLNLNVY